MSSKPTTKCWAAFWTSKANHPLACIKTNPPNPPSLKGGLNEPLFLKRGWGDLDPEKNNQLLFFLIVVNTENQNYLVTVERFFLTLKDSGLALSATDYDLIQQWEGRGIPVNVVCRGIENGVAEFDRQNNRQSSRVGLSYLKVFVEEELERSQL